MELIERVYLAAFRAMVGDGANPERLPASYAHAKAAADAAIRAMLGGVELVAWRYDDGEGSWELIADTSAPFAIALVQQGYTGKPLYSLDALKEALDHV